MPSNHIWGFLTTTFRDKQNKMIISGNTITFELTDIALLPVATQEALAAYVVGVSAAVSLSTVINSFLTNVVAQAPGQSLDRLKDAFVAASPATQALAEVKLDEARVILGI